MANEIQKYTFSTVPNAGEWRPVYDSEAAPTTLNDVATAGDVQGCLRSISGIGTPNADVTGNYSLGFTVEFVSGKANTNMVTLAYQDNTLTAAATSLGVNVYQEGGGGNDEGQDIGFTADGGTVSIIWAGYGTAANIPYNADTTAFAIAVALVFGIDATATVFGVGNWRVVFGGSLANTDMPTPTFTNNLTNAVAISVVVLQEGSAPPAGPLASLTSSTTSIAENGGTVSVIATLDATASATVNVVVGFSGTANDPADYTKSGTTISIASGSTSGSIGITAINDLVYEGTETVTASITSVSGGAASSSTNSVSSFTITDDEAQPTVTLQVSPSTIAENLGAAVVTAVLSHLSVENVTVNLSFSGTATNATDYTRSTTAILIVAGQSSGSAGITSLADATFEGSETVIVDVSSVVNGTESGTQSVTVTITDQQSAPTVNLTSNTSSIVENAGVANVSALLSNPSTQNVTVSFTFAGTATNVTDYTRSTDSIVIAAGNSSGSISITAIQDSVGEGNETVIVSVGSVVNGSAGTAPSTTITITDDELVTFVGFATPTTPEGSTVNLGVRLNRSSTDTITTVVEFTGTATRDVDWTSSAFSGTSATVSFAPTVVLVFLGIATIQDVIDEPSETVIGTITSASGGGVLISVNSSSSTVTITDDDAAPTVILTANTSSIVENGGIVIVSASLSSVSGLDAVVNFAFSGSATLNTDYSRSTDSITIAAGSTTGSISITAIQDVVDETDETIIVSVVSSSTASAGTASTVTITIADDDAALGTGAQGLSGLSGLSGIH